MPYEWSLTVTLEVVKALGPVIVGGIVGYVAWRQWRTAHDKLAMELFERRFNVFKTVAEAIEKRSTEVTLAPKLVKRSLAVTQAPENIAALRTATMEARFLFGADVVDVLIAIEAALVDEQRAFDAFDGMISSIDDFFRARQYTANLAKELGSIVQPYMMLDKIGVNRPNDAGVVSGKFVGGVATTAVTFT